MKKFYQLVLSLVAVMAITGCSSLSQVNKEEQQELMTHFLETFYSYQFNDENIECSKSGNDICEKIVQHLTPYLTSNTNVDEQTIYSLLVKPAAYSEVSVDYISYKIVELKTYEKNRVYSYQVEVDVKFTNDVTQEEYVKTLSSKALNLVKENGNWKIESIDYMVDDFLFEK